MTATIYYKKASDLRKQHSRIVKQIAMLPGVKRVCDIGGGANPALDLELVQKAQLDYTVLDISQPELDKAPSEYHKICQDITDPNLQLPGQYDFMFSRMLAEHVQSGEAFHRNIYNHLSEKGIAFHFFPTFYAFPFLMNYLLPETFASLILDIVAPRNRYQADKFPALYEWCYGPTPANIARFESLGYVIVGYIGGYGHRYYERIAPLNKLEEIKQNLLIRNPNPYLTSYAYIITARSEDNIISQQGENWLNHLFES